MNLPLGLIRNIRPAPPVAAGWLATSDPTEWLREIAHCRSQGCMVSIYPVAASAADPRAVGIFLVPRDVVPKFRSRVMPLGEILPGVFGPHDASLSAGTLPNEREFHFAYPLNFFHPAIGLVGFDPKDELAPTRILALAPKRNELWNLAIPAARFAPELKEILVDDPPPPDEILANAAQEIGDQSDKPPGKSGGILGTAALVGLGLTGGALMGAGSLLGVLGNLFNLSGGRMPGNRNDLLNRLKDWAEKNWQQLADSRSREIDRLIKLMEKDPDAGLRYALPLAGIENSRGVAAPSWKLGQRGTRFSHGNGGGAVDGWEIAYQARLNLERQYREAAKREITLGRHDRAAYIYGNLLGDWRSAAQTLAACGRHRDAVSIYLHKLNNRAAAARSLEDAGLLQQAAGIYAECKEFEKAGDLHFRLGNQTKAIELWQAEVEAQRDPLEKARILSEKLGDQVAALLTLDAAWLSGNRPQQALSAMFAIHRKSDSPDSALDLLKRLFAEDIGSFSLAEKLKLGHQECAHFAAPEFSAAFENEAYYRIGQALSVGAGDNSSLLAFLPQLDHEDLLLSRDAKRYSIRKIPPKIPRTGTPQGVLRPNHVVSLPTGTRWDSIATLPKGISIAGYGAEMLCVAQVRDGACHSSALRTKDDPGKCEVRHLAITSQQGTSRLFHFKKFKRLHYRAIDRLRTPAEDAIGTLRNILAACPYGNDGDFALLEHTNTSSLSVSIYSESAALRRTLPIDLAPPEIGDLDWRMAGRGGQLCLAAQGFVAWRNTEGEFTTMNLGESPGCLHISPVNRLPEVLISLSTDVLIIDIPKSGRQMETVNLFSNPSLSKPPISCFLPDGSVIIAHTGGGLVFSTQDRVNPCASLSIPTNAGNPIDICPHSTKGFAVLTDIGNLLVFDP